MRWSVWNSTELTWRENMFKPISFKSSPLWKGPSEGLWIHYKLMRNNLLRHVERNPSACISVSICLTAVFLPAPSMPCHLHRSHPLAPSDLWPTHVFGGRREIVCAKYPERSEVAVHHRPHPELEPLVPPHPSPSLGLLAFIWNMCYFPFKLGGPEPWRAPQVSVVEASQLTQTHTHRPVTY